MSVDMDLNEFRDLGYLQEVNRKFFHPLGLALAVQMDDEGNVEGLASIWDIRDDPEGMVYEDGDLSASKAKYVKGEWHRRAEAREKAVGYTVQPVPGV